MIETAKELIKEYLCAK